MTNGTSSPRFTPPPVHLEWREVVVDGRPARYGVAGSGRPIVFLHGWGLAHRSYRRGLKRLVQPGVAVYALAMPGFGGTAELPKDEFSIAGYARWVAAALDQLGIDEPVILIGHSFGGGVSIQVAHDFPGRVRQLILVNSIGGSVWGRRGDKDVFMRDRPLWDWGLHLPAETFSRRQLKIVLPIILADAVPNIVRQPGTVWKVGQLARRADLTPELEQLKERRLPVVILWGQSDEVIPPACLRSLSEALGSPRVVTVDGNHNWLLDSPDLFGEVITNIISHPDTSAA
jgi:pimeloyl-ACP methyl ester carboxylesterase